MQFRVVNVFSFKVINIHPKGRIRDVFGIQRSSFRSQNMLRDTSNYFLYTEFEPDTSP